MRVKTLLDWLGSPLWQPRPGMGWALEIYRAFNFVEALAWFVFAALVVGRWAKNRRSDTGGPQRTILELSYAAAFAAFGLSDVREAFVLQPWLILAKGAILTALLALRSIVIRRYYPASRTF